MIQTITNSVTNAITNVTVATAPTVTVTKTFGIKYVSIVGILIAAIVVFVIGRICWPKSE